MQSWRYSTKVRETGREGHECMHLWKVNKLLLCVGMLLAVGDVIRSFKFVVFTSVSSSPYNCHYINSYFAGSIPDHPNSVKLAWDLEISVSSFVCLSVCYSILVLRMYICTPSI